MERKDGKEDMVLKFRKAIAVMSAVAVVVSATGQLDVAEAKKSNTLAIQKMLSNVKVSPSKISLQVTQKGNKIMRSKKKIALKYNKKLKLKGIKCTVKNKKVAKSNKSGYIIAQGKGNTSVTISATFKYKSKTYVKKLTCKVTVKKIVKKDSAVPKDTPVPVLPEPTHKPITTAEPSSNPGQSIPTLTPIEPPVTTIPPGGSPSISPSVPPSVRPSYTPIPTVSPTPTPDVDKVGCDKLEKYLYTITGSNSISLTQSTDANAKLINPSPRYTIDGKVYEVSSMEAGVFSLAQIVNVPYTVTRIDVDNILANELTSINVDSKNYYYSSDSGALYSYNYRSLLKVPSKTGSTNFVVNNKATSISKYAFKNNENVESVHTGSGVTTLEANAFTGAKKLNKVILGDNVRNVSVDTFNDCSSLKSIDVDSANKTFEELDDMLIEINSSKLVRVPEGKLINTDMADIAIKPENVIPTGIKIIEANAFRNNAGLKEIKISDSVKTIGAYAFANCKALSVVNIAYDKETEVKPDDTVSTVTTGSSITDKEPVKPAVKPDIKIGNYAFSSCGRLVTVGLGEKVGSIGTYAFENCRGLEIKVPETVESVGLNAFRNVDKVIYKGKLDVSSWGCNNITAKE